MQNNGKVMMKRMSDSTPSIRIAVVAWFVCFIGHSEELHVMFAVIYGLIWAHVVRRVHMAELGCGQC